MLLSIPLALHRRVKTSGRLTAVWAFRRCSTAIPSLATYRSAGRHFRLFRAIIRNDQLESQNRHN